MDIKEIGEFYKDFVTSKDFTEEMQNKLRLIRDEEEYREFVNTYVIPKAVEKEYTFSVDDILKYEQIMLNSLNEEDLANVAGGRTFIEGDKHFVPVLLLFASLNID